MMRATEAGRSHGVSRRPVVLAATLCLLAMPLPTALAASNYQTGKINNVTFAGDNVLIKLDSGLPDNCAGTAYGWMLIPSASKATSAMVIGLWLRGDMAQTTVTIFTPTGIVNNYCQVDQIDPIE